MDMQVRLFKVTATGNDFIVIDLLDGGLVNNRPEMVRQWCNRHNGIGADGAVFLEKHPSHDFAWDFYNSDGSAAEMCGNAARAVSLYVYQRSGKTALSFLTRTGVVSAEVRSRDDIEVALAPIAEEQWNQWGENLNFDFVRAGVPHAILRVPDVADREALRTLALEVKRDERFRATGTNVTFVTVKQPTVIESVTFERGVEDFTLACGTGAVAAAHALLRGEEQRPIEVRVPGGTLFVIWKQGRPYLRGPARVVAEIRWLDQGG